MDFFVFTDYFTDYLRECKLKITEKRNKFHFVILENKRFHTKALLTRFHLNGRNPGFCLQTLMVEFI